MIAECELSLLILLCVTQEQVEWVVKCINEFKQMKSNNATPLVSVAVMAYNSAGTIIETLESVKAQTYTRLELVIGDDGSKDDTISLCCEWIAKNEERFERVELLENPINQGTSVNYNRVMDACQGVWVKDLDGDDLLNADCIEQFIAYIQNNPDSNYIFCRVQGFTKEGDKIVLKNIEAFNYDFFQWPVDKQLHYLLFERNCVPSPGLFYNLTKVREIGLRNDERIYLLEDWPKWINALRMGLHFSFIDETLVMYRVGNGISTSNMLLPRYYETCRRFVMLYQYPEWIKTDPEDAMERIVAHEMHIYDVFYQLNRRYQTTTHSYAYRLGKWLLKPIKWITKG